MSIIAKEFKRMGIALLLVANLFTSSLLLADGDHTVDGLEKVQSDIRKSTPPYTGLGPWRLTFKGVNPERHDIKMQPEKAFTTIRETANPRDFMVTLVNPAALLDEYGNLFPLGVSVVDITGGPGQFHCEVRATFLSTGTHLPLPLEQISKSNPQNIRLDINPAGAAELVRYDGNEAVIKRLSDNKTNITVTLFLLSGGNWNKFYSERALPVCSSGTPAPVSPTKPKYVWETWTENRTFQISNESIGTIEHRLRSNACDSAKRDLKKMLDDTECAVKASDLYDHYGADRHVRVIEASAEDFSATCSCERMSWSSCWTCDASGSATCHVQIEIEQRRQLN